MRTSILIIVSAVVILIIAVVLVTMFSGGIERFLQIWGVFSTDQLVKSSCQTSCQEVCTSTGSSSGWGTVKVGGVEYSCSQYGVSCDCSRYTPGGLVPGTSEKLAVGQTCTTNEQCVTNKCDPTTKKCVY
jgi:hypothetical protein